MYGGRGSAKSWTVARKLLLRGAAKKQIILCTRELQKSIKQSVHRLLKDQVNYLGLGGFYEVQQQGIYGKNGTEFIFLGTKHNPDEIKSTEGIDICWIEEGHNLTESSWDVIDPTIRKDESEIWITYNTRFKFDHLHKIFVIDEPPPESWVCKVNHNDNPFFPRRLQIQMENMKEKDFEKYLHIWEGELKQLAEGAIFGKQIIDVKKPNKEGVSRLLNIPVAKNSEVDTYWDLGKNDQTCIWFVQTVGKERRFIDYYENRLEEIEHYVKHIKSLDYNYGTHYMPHDADQDRLGMSRNIRQQFEDAGIKPIEIVPQIQDKNTAIQLAREIFPNCWFHKANDERGERTERGFDTLCNYRYKYKEDDDVYQNTPYHDWASHGADAFMQFAQWDAEEYEFSASPLSINTNYVV